MAKKRATSEGGRYSTVGQPNGLMTPPEWGTMTEEEIKDAVFMGHPTKQARYMPNDPEFLEQRRKNGWYEADDSHVPKALAPEVVKPKRKPGRPKKEETVTEDGA